MVNKLMLIYSFFGSENIFVCTKEIIYLHESGDKWYIFIYK